MSSHMQYYCHAHKHSGLQLRFVKVTVLCRFGDAVCHFGPGLAYRGGIPDWLVELVTGSFVALWVSNSADTDDAIVAPEAHWGLRRVVGGAFGGHLILWCTSLAEQRANYERGSQVTKESHTTHKWRTLWININKDEIHPKPMFSTAKSEVRKSAALPTAIVDHWILFFLLTLKQL